MHTSNRHNCHVLPARRNNATGSIRDTVGNLMQLKDVKVSDRFWLNGVKYSVFMKVKRPRVNPFTIAFVEWPMPDEVFYGDSDVEVKPIQRIA